MRIALVSPRTQQVDLADHAIRTSAAAGLGLGLTNRGHKVTRFEVQDSALDSDEPLARLVDCAKDFDLIQTFAGCRSLSYLRSLKTPVIALVSQAMVQQAPDLFAPGSTVRYVVDSQAQAVGALASATVIPWNAPPDQGDLLTSAFEVLYSIIAAEVARTDHRPWGYYVVLADEPDHKVKRIVVYPGKRLSLQKHRKRSEHWFLLSGEGLVTRDEEQIRLTPGRCVEIPVGAWHRIQNPAQSEMAFIEVQTGDYFGEDDIERKEDDFGRA